ncbi:MAG TPA: DUF6491 family protein [Candidatus Saccharimonadia bacterium]|nr:DUF6491 family protein [Candidatus Saccharimonadia bacterium]
MYRKLAVVALLALPAFAQAATPGTPQSPLPTRECLAPSTTFDWARIDDTHVVFEGLGRRHFLVETSTLCTELGRLGATIRIDAGPLNRLCGRFGEAIIASGQRCRVKSVTPISKDEYRRMRRGEIEPPKRTRE